MRLLLIKEATEKNVRDLIERLQWMGFSAQTHQENGYYTISIDGGYSAWMQCEAVASQLPFVSKILPSNRPFKLVSRSEGMERVTLDINGVKLGGGYRSVIAGPCAIESEEQIHLIAEKVAHAGANFLRGGAFKPRTSPYSFQGLGVEGLRYLHAAGKEHGLVTVSEVMSVEAIEKMYPYVDVFQVGSRSMQNFDLLKELGKVDKPILLKRGFSATYLELLMSAEYILNGGNERVILCERGVRTFETYTRNTLDLTAIPVLQDLSFLPVIADPSHGTGWSRFVSPMAKGAFAVGADAVMIEVHPEPKKSLSDPEQALDFAEFELLMNEMELIAPNIRKQTAALC